MADRREGYMADRSEGYMLIGVTVYADGVKGIWLIGARGIFNFKFVFWELNQVGW